MVSSRRAAGLGTAAAALLVLASASRPVFDEDVAGGRALLQDFGSNTLTGFRPGTHSGDPCPAGQQHCNFQDRCVNVLADSLNCGRCSNACDFNTEVCSSGRCTCKPGTTFCGNVGKCFSNCDGFERGAVVNQAQAGGLTAGGALSTDAANGVLSG